MKYFCVCICTHDLIFESRVLPFKKRYFHFVLPLFFKVENLLISNQGTIKLCDFGSATTVAYYPDYSWSAQKRALVEEEVRISYCC